MNYEEEYKEYEEFATKELKAQGFEIGNLNQLCKGLADAVKFHPAAMGYLTFEFMMLSIQDLAATNPEYVLDYIQMVEEVCTDTRLLVTTGKPV